MNFYTGRIFFVKATFYFLLIISLKFELGDSEWGSVFALHVYAHIMADLVLLPLKLLQICLPSSALSALSQILPRFHPSDEFTAHEAVSNFAIDLGLFCLAMTISEALAYIILAKLVLCYLISWITVRSAETTKQNFHSPVNLDFLEACFSFLTLTFSLILQTPILVSSLKHCHLIPVSKMLKSAKRNLQPAMAAAPPVQIFLTALAIFLGALLLRSKVREFCLGNERAQLRRHLEDLNQDKCYQVMKQRQWYPLCKCHERQTRQRRGENHSKK